MALNNQNGSRKKRKYYEEDLFSSEIDRALLSDFESDEESLFGEDTLLDPNFF